MISKRISNLVAGSELRAQLIRGVSGTAGVTTLGMIITLTLGVMLARALGPSQYGVYTFVISLITLIGLPTKAGLPSLVVREAAKYQLRGQWGYLRGLLTLSNVLVIIFSLVAAITILGVLYGFYGFDEGDDQFNTLLWSLLLLPLVAFASIRGATLRGFRKPVRGIVPEKIIIPLVMIVLVAGVVYCGVQLTPVLVMQINIAASLLGFFVGAFLLIRVMPKEVGSTRPMYETKPWIISLLPLSLFVGMKTADSQISIVILNTLTSSEDVGLFRVAVQGSSLVAFAVTIISSVVAPYIARLYAENRLAKLQSLITMATRISFFVALPVSIIFILWGDLLIGFVFGDEYLPATTALSILCYGQLFSASTGLVAVTLNMAGFAKESLKGIAVALLLNCILGLILIPKLGVIGAAMANTLSLVVWNLLMVRAVYVKMGINAFILVGKRA